jgi:hypothetical protein
MNGMVLGVGDRVRPSSAANGKRAGLDSTVPGSQDLFRAVLRKTEKTRQREREREICDAFCIQYLQLIQSLGNDIPVIYHVGAC